MKHRDPKHRYVSAHRDEWFATLTQLSIDWLQCISAAQGNLVDFRLSTEPVAGSGRLRTNPSSSSGGASNIDRLASRIAHSLMVRHAISASLIAYGSSLFVGPRVDEAEIGSLFHRPTWLSSDYLHCGGKRGTPIITNCVSIGPGGSDRHGQNYHMGGSRWGLNGRGRLQAMTQRRRDEFKPKGANAKFNQAQNALT